MLQEVGDLKDSDRALALEESILRNAELDSPVRANFLAIGYTLNAVDCILVGDRKCANSSLDNNPLKEAYATAGRNSRFLQ